MPLTLLAGPLLVVGACLWLLRLYFIARRHQRAPPHKQTVGFFHPYWFVKTGFFFSFFFLSFSSRK
jgi:hypothetical protein